MKPDGAVEGSHVRGSFQTEAPLARGQRGEYPVGITKPALWPLPTLRRSSHGLATTTMTRSRTGPHRLHADRAPVWQL